MTTEWFVHDEGPLPGIAEFIPAGRDLSDADIENISFAIDEARLPVQATLGLSEAWTNLLRSFAHRQLVRELPVEDRVLPWLCVHAPPGGSTSTRLSGSVTTEQKLSFSIFGSGFGTGRGVVVTSANESAFHPGCATYTWTLSVKPVVYSRGAEESVEVTILDVRGMTVDVRSREQCSWCTRLDTAREDPLMEPKSFVDLISAVAEQTFTFSIDTTGERKIEAGFAVPAIKTELKLIAGLAAKSTIETRFRLPPGQRYQSYSFLHDERSALHGTLWAVSV